MIVAVTVAVDIKVLLLGPLRIPLGVVQLVGLEDLAIPTGDLPLRSLLQLIDSFARRDLLLTGHRQVASVNKVGQ